MGRFQMKARAAARAAFDAATVSGLTFNVTSAAVEGTALTTIALTGYRGTFTVAAQSANARVTFGEGGAVLAGATPFLINESIPVWITAAGGARRAATLVATVEALETPIALTLRATDAKFLDLTEQLSVCPDGNMVTLALTGTVSAHVWQFAALTTGQSKAHTKAELLRSFYLSTSAAADSPAAATLTLTFNDGAAETGSPVAVEVGIAVDDSPVLTHDHGAKSMPRHGGFDLRTIDVGPWTLTSAVDRNAASATTYFEVFDSRIVFAPNAATASTLYGTTRMLTTPLTGDGAYSITVNSAISGQHVVTFNVIPYRYSIGAIPATIAQSLGNFPLRAVMRATDRNWGDEVVVEDCDWDFRVSGTNQKLLFSGTATQRSGGPAAPVDRGDAGWIKVYPKNPLGCSFTSILQLNTETINAPFFHLKGFDIGSAGVLVISQNGTRNASDLWFSENYGTGGFNNTISVVDATNFGTHSRLYYHDNWLVGIAAKLTVNAYDSEVVGNLIRGSGQDAMRPCILNSVVGSGKSKIWFNFLVDKKYADPTGASHVDYAQIYFTGSNFPMATVVDVTTVEIASFIGNVLTRGDGSYNVQTSVPNRYEEDGQGYFLDDMTVLYRTLSLVHSNVFATIMTNGIFARQPAAGSVFSYNTIQPAWDIFGLTWGSGTGNPRIRLVANGSGSGLAEIANNIMSNTISLEDGTTATETGNVTITNTLVAAQTAFAAPEDLGVLPDVAAAIACLTPIDGALAGKGAINNSLVDIRKRTIDASVLA